MASTSPSVQDLLAQLQTAGSAYAEQKPGARELLLSLSNTLTAALELPSETIQRIGWAEVSSFYLAMEYVEGGLLIIFNCFEWEIIACSIGSSACCC